MSTRQQRAAIRRKAERSANPSAAQAQPPSGFDALKHGIVANNQIMFDESEPDLAQLDAEIRDQYKPANPTERFLVDSLVHNEWRLRRMRVVEAALWDHAGNVFLAEHTESPTCNSAHAFTAGAAAFERLQRIVNACERNYHRALKELQRLQAAQSKAGLAAVKSPQPEQSTPTSTPLASFRRTPQTAPHAPGNPLRAASLSAFLGVEEPRNLPEVA